MENGRQGKEDGPGGFWVVPILHPAYINRGNWALDPMQPEYIRAAKELVEGSWRPEFPDHKPEGAVINPTVEELRQWRSQVNGPVVVDIETAGTHLVLIGFCCVRTEQCLVVRFRGRRGVPWFSDRTTLVRHIEYVYDILADPSIPLVFHNGQAFDIPFLEAMGFRVENVVWDTLIAWGHAWPEIPKRLEFLATYLCRIPRWKHIIKDDEQGVDK